MSIHKATIITFFILLTGISGCQTLDDLDRENYQRACDNLGIVRGTATYDECMMQQQRMDNDDLQRSMDRSSEERIFKKL